MNAATFEVSSGLRKQPIRHIKAAGAGDLPFINKANRNPNSADGPYVSIAHGHM
jgi:hypothetical protein